jgi:hypothetical protein
MKEYTFNNNVKMATCDGCGYQTPFWNTIDHWALVNGKEYCRKCQKLKLDN